MHRGIASCVLACWIAGCSAPPPPRIAARAPEPAPLPVIPPLIANQLGDAEVVIAADLSHFAHEALEAKIPEEIACLRDVVRAPHLVVLEASPHAAEWQLWVTPVPRATTTRCFEQAASALGLGLVNGADHLELTVRDSVVALAWDAETLIAQSARNRGVPGRLSPEMRALIAGVPRDATVWIAIGPHVRRELAHAVGWLAKRGDQVTFEVRCTTREGSARGWLEGFIGGFKESAVGHQIAVDDRWFQITEAGRDARLVVTLPAETLAAMLAGGH